MMVANVSFENAIPILRVAELAASLRYYTMVLGFNRDWGGDAGSPGMASVSRGNASLMLCQGAQGCVGTWVWFGVDDADALHEQYRRAGATVVQPPTNFSWALEFRVRDPDGHVLRFGSDPDRNRPFRDELA